MSFGLCRVCVLCVKGGGESSGVIQVLLYGTCIFLVDGMSGVFLVHIYLQVIRIQIEIGYPVLRRFSDRNHS